MPDAPGLELIRGEIERDHPGAVLATSFDREQPALIVDPARILDVLGWLREEPGQRYRFLASLHAADYLPAEPRFEAIGGVDELNSALGVLAVALAGHAHLAGVIRVQNDLFDLGADLAVPQREGKAERLRVLASQVTRLENDIDTLNADLAELTSFVLPGGTPAAAYLHLARTICRRAERIMVELAAQPNEPVSDAAIQYMNWLSDFLFVASRFMNDKGACDVLWVPGQNR